MECVPPSRKAKTMNYIAEINGFERWLENNYLPALSELLWYKLMYRCNRAGWAEWVTVDNLRLMADLRIESKNTFLRCRDALIDAGLIECQKGKKGAPNKYRLISFEKKGSNFEPKMEPEMTLKTEPQTELKVEPQTELETGHIYKQKHKQKHNIKKGGTSVPPEKADAFLPEVAPEPEPKAPVENRQADYTAVRDLYHSICRSYPRVTVLSEKRKKAISAKMRTGYTLDDFKRTFEMAESSDFLKGQNKKNWSADFDWMIADSNMAKILDGKYRNRNAGGEPDAGGGSTEDFYRRYLAGCDG